MDILLCKLLLLALTPSTNLKRSVAQFDSGLLHVQSSLAPNMKPASQVHLYK